MTKIGIAKAEQLQADSNLEQMLQNYVNSSGINHFPGPSIDPLNEQLDEIPMDLEENVEVVDSDSENETSDSKSRKRVVDKIENDIFFEVKLYPNQPTFTYFHSY